MRVTCRRCEADVDGVSIRPVVPVRLARPPTVPRAPVGTPPLKLEHEVLSAVPSGRMPGERRGVAASREESIQGNRFFFFIIRTYSLLTLSSSVS